MPTVLITGANRGIGLGLVKYYLKNQFKVYACCKTPGKATELNELAKLYSSSLVIKMLDVSLIKAITSLGESLKEEPIDILINNAGIWSPNTPLSDVSINDWHQSFTVNTMAALLVTQSLISNLKQGKIKAVGNLSSRLASIEDNQSGEFYCYRSSKAALNAITRSMAIDLKPLDIKVFALDPGWVKTDMGGDGAQIEVEESVLGLVNILANFKLSQSGNFLDYKGQVVPW